MDDEPRSSAFAWLKEQSAIHGEVLPREVLAAGFEFSGIRITLVGPSGIWRPHHFAVPLSITSTSNSPYDDGFTDAGLLNYRYRGNDPNHRDNVGLREAWRTRTPLIYFHGVVPGRYVAVWPVFVYEDRPEELCCLVAIDPAYAFGQSAEKTTSGAELGQESSVSVRRYVAAVTKRRLHQSFFRERVILAYSETCSLCRLHHRELLDAAHIIPDTEPSGDPIVPNGLSLCKIHHAAFDQNILGVSPDYRVFVRQDVLEETDGPMLMHGLQELHGSKIYLPSRKADLPDPERLGKRFERFRMAG